MAADTIQVAGSTRQGVSRDRRYFHALGGLKVICLLLILVWHCGVIKRPDLGARCCEIFFVVSGFLEGVGHQFSWEYSVGESVRFWWKKTKAVWPLFVAVFLASLCWSCAEGSVQLDSSTMVTYAFYLTLTHAWIPSIAINGKLSGASWFISALLFCYAMTPAIAWGVRHVAAAASRRGWTKGRGCLAAAALFLVVRVFLDLAAREVKVPYSVHTCPMVRLFEYAGAYAVGCWYIMRAKRRDGLSLPLATVRELIVTAGYVSTVIIGNGVLWRSTYIILAIVLVVAFAGEGGLVFGTFIPSAKTFLGIFGHGGSIHPVIEMNVFGASVWGYSVWMLYLVAGALIADGKLRSVPQRRLALLGIACPFTACTVAQFLAPRVSLMDYSFVGTVVIAISLFELMDRGNSVASRLNNRIISIGCLLSRLSFSVYMLHLFVFGALCHTDVVPLIAALPSVLRLIAYLFLVVVVLLGSSLIGLVLSRIKPIGKWLLLVK